MSCYNVGPTHIDAILTAATEWIPQGTVRWLASQRGCAHDHCTTNAEYTERTRTLDHTNVDGVGQILVDQNARSVNYRYNEGLPAEPYRFRYLRGTPDPLVVLQALEGYEYQSCEDPGWHTSEARQIIAAIREVAIAQAVKSVDGKGWHIEDRNVFSPLRASAPSEAEDIEQAICANCGEQIRLAFRGDDCEVWDHPGNDYHTVCNWTIGIEETDVVATPVRAEA